MTPYRIEIIDHDQGFQRILPRLNAADVLALDIETINWWSRDEERISIIQIGFRENDQITVAICDLLTGWNPEPLRFPLETSLQTKVIHNASYDAVRLARHYGIRTSPVYDTMLAARRSGEKKYSLQALVERHLGLTIEKTEQRSDWSRRPLSRKQLDYAALDAVCTLELYEKQVARGLRGDYELRPPTQPPAVSNLKEMQRQEMQRQNDLRKNLQHPAPIISQTDDSRSLTGALMRIVTEFPGRYTARQLSASITDGRSGMIGWILDQTLGPDLTFDEATTLTTIEQLCADHQLAVNSDGRLIKP